MIIRHEDDADHASIMALTYAAFENHPHHAPGALPTEHLIYKSLKDRGDLSISLVAEDDGVVIGHIAFSPVTFDGESSNWMGLGPASVRPDRQCQGIGSTLILEGLAQSKQIGRQGVVLIGDPKYYNRFGFSSDHSLFYPDLPSEYLLTLSFASDQSREPRGQVGYSPAFG